MCACIHCVMREHYTLDHGVVIRLQFNAQPSIYIVFLRRFIPRFSLFLISRCYSLIKLCKLAGSCMCRISPVMKFNFFPFVLNLSKRERKKNTVKVNAQRALDDLKMHHNLIPHPIRRSVIPIIR